MFALLGWLYNRAYRVYAFFGTLYYRIRDAALYALQWAKGEARSALKEAKRVIGLLIRGLDTGLRILIKATVGAIRDIAKNAFKLAIRAFAYVEAFYNERIRPQIKNLLKMVVELPRRIQIELALLKAEIKKFVYNTIQQKIKDAFDRFFTSEPMRTWYLFFTPDNLRKLADVLNRMYYFLFSLIRSPLQFVMGMVKLVFMNFLEFSLGYAMGATTRTLPRWPTWDEMEGRFGPTPSAPPGTGKLRHPVEPLYISGYSWMSHPTHYGTDFGLENDQPVFAAHSGIVETASWVEGGWGFRITLAGPMWWSSYAHLGTLLVNSGEAVSAGQLIAYGDDTGQSTGPHLDFRVKHLGKYVDPMNVL